MKSIADTKFGEELRKVRKSVAHSVQRTLRRQLGKIDSLDPKGKNRAKIRLDDGTLVAGGRFIRLKNSPSEIAHRFGALRRGLRVEVLYAGEVEQVGMAEVIASEFEPKDTILLPNDINKNQLYGMFI